MVQIDEPNPAVNLPQFLVGHFPCHVMLEEHGIEDKALGSWMPMKASILLGIFDKALVDAIGEFEVKAHGVVVVCVGGVG